MLISSIIFMIVVAVSVTYFFLIKFINSKYNDNTKNYKLSEQVVNKFRHKYPGITIEEYLIVWTALRSFMRIVANDKVMGGKKVFGMPSIIVDSLWHEFILDTKNYHHYCENHCNGYVHHVPGEIFFEVDFTDKELPKDFKESFDILMKKDKAKIKGMPLIFEIDELFELKGGFRFNKNKLLNQSNKIIYKYKDF